MDGAPVNEFPVALTHGGRYLQYDIFGNLFEITSKYRPPIMPIGRGAYGIVWAPELLLNSTDYTAAIDMWSVGCIFMELMNRKPLFPGRDHMHQMRLITELIGTPTESELEFILNEDARRYMRHLPRYPRQSFATLYPHINPVAIDLIERMLTFDPTKRITELWEISDVVVLSHSFAYFGFFSIDSAVEEALDHPYLERLHDIADEPTCTEPFSFDFEQHALTEDQMKELIYKEAIAFNPAYKF
ncbi:hypothetical protein BHM03_00023293 [Ensete ventricosum]|nr:hypothetical protein BHM03_00023293 [Ensete ventricosum]